ncbi:MAG: hypothetical protein F6K19_37695 [Cyanothece sp. SIO1E1]|nr:hypothetical protein [Cyanothece sp. SIO1E1]
MKQREFQEQYDLLTEKIRYLQQSATIDDLAPSKLFQLKKQLEQDEAERDELAQKIEDLRKASVSEELYRALLKLDYRKQVRLFKKLIKSQSIAACLIQGSLDGGQRWLLNRLIKYLPQATTSKIIRVDLHRLARKRDVNAMWRELGKRVYLSSQNSSSEITERIYQWWQTQNVILVFDDVDCLPGDYVKELINDFWSPLTSKLGSPSSRNKSSLLMFLVAYGNCFEDHESLFMRELTPSWLPHIPIKLPEISSLSYQVLTDWFEALEIEHEFKSLSEELVRFDDPTQMIWKDSNSGIPQLVLERICELFAHNWCDQEDKWLIV